jgi:hypothetical protein
VAARSVAPDEWVVSMGFDMYDQFGLATNRDRVLQWWPHHRQGTFRFLEWHLSKRTQKAALSAQFAVRSGEACFARRLP